LADENAEQLKRPELVAEAPGEHSQAPAHALRPLSESPLPSPWSWRTPVWRSQSG
jgi:hypothetical protein